MKTSILLILSLLLVGCSSDLRNPVDCIRHGFGGIAVGTTDTGEFIFQACSDGKLTPDGKYIVTIDGIKPIFLDGGLRKTGVATTYIKIEKETK